MKRTEVSMHGGKHIFGLIAAFIATAIAFVLAVNLTFPRPPGGQAGKKLAWLDRHGEDYDIVFFGTSYTWTGVDPAVIERETGMKAFNFGVNAGQAYEMWVTLENFLNSRPENIEWLAIEVNCWEPPVADRKLGTSRSVSSSRPKMIFFFLRGLFESNRPTDRKWELAWRHLHYLMKNLLPLGAGYRLQHDDVSLSSHGFAFTGPGGVTLLDRNTEAYLAKVERFRRESRGAREAIELHPHSLRRLVNELRHSGLNVVWYVPPHMRTPGPEGEIAEIVAPEPMYFFNDPLAYPQLFEPQMRRDTLHLSWNGAQEFSALLGDKISRHRRELAAEADLMESRPL